MDLKNLKVGQSVTAKVHGKDDLLSGFTYEDLITAVVSNHPKRDKAAVTSTFDEMLEAAVDDAKALLQKEMAGILDMIKAETKGY